MGDLSFGFLAELRRKCVHSSVRLHTMDHVKLSAPAEAFCFDFYTPSALDPATGTPADREVRLQLPVLRKGTCNCIAWWFDLLLDDETTLPAGPGAPVRTWKQNLAHLMQPQPVQRGDTLEALLWIERDDQIHALGGRPGTVVRPVVKGGGSEKPQMRIERNFG